MDGDRCNPPQVNRNVRIWDRPDNPGTVNIAGDGSGASDRVVDASEAREEAAGVIET